MRRRPPLNASPLKTASSRTTSPTDGSKNLAFGVLAFTTASLYRPALSDLVGLSRAWSCSPMPSYSFLRPSRQSAVHVKTIPRLVAGIERAGAQHGPVFGLRAIAVILITVPIAGAPGAAMTNRIAVLKKRLVRVEVVVLRGPADQAGLIIELRSRSDARRNAERQHCHKKSHVPPPGRMGVPFQGRAAEVHPACHPPFHCQYMT